MHMCMHVCICVRICVRICVCICVSMLRFPCWLTSLYVCVYPHFCSFVLDYYIHACYRVNNGAHMHIHLCSLVCPSHLPHYPGVPPTSLRSLQQHRVVNKLVHLHLWGDSE